jgi:hypothetical protein
MTSYPYKIDLINAGAEWHDKVVVDRDWLLAEIK